MKNNINESLDGIYKFMSHAYNGNWQYRWSETPYLEENIKAGKHESILGHQWACIGFWFYLRRICPSLDGLVDTTEIYERLWGHDLGETFEGDISQFAQVAGKGADKHIVERKEIEKMGETLPKEILDQMLKWFDEMENGFENVEKLEALVAKFIDTIQGNHFVVVFGNNLPENGEMINKIIGRSFVPVSRQLLKVLKDQGQKRAYEEVVEVITYNLDFFEKAGVKINPDFYSK
ncbi:MAG: HD domain-containing protein [Candidatus Paceibacterota bacterium]|jgi:5'-deoxynucleotidase YfbR-like HD superfamily hydrolase